MAAIKDALKAIALKVIDDIKELLINRKACTSIIVLVSAWLGKLFGA